MAVGGLVVGGGVVLPLPEPLGKVPPLPVVPLDPPASELPEPVLSEPGSPEFSVPLAGVPISSSHPVVAEIIRAAAPAASRTPIFFRGLLIADLPEFQAAVRPPVEVLDHPLQRLVC
jgi:hypothetical protein